MPLTKFLIAYIIWPLTDVEDSNAPGKALQRSLDGDSQIRHYLRF
jgi:hypothetical protein